MGSGNRGIHAYKTHGIHLHLRLRETLSKAL